MGSVSDNPEVVLNIVEEPPPKIHNDTSAITNVSSPVIAAKRLIASLKRMWSDYFRPETLGEGGVMKPRSAYKLVIFGLLSFAAIKAQGGTTLHPQIGMVSVTSLLMFGFASYAVSVVPPVYAVIARLVGKLCLFILVGSLACLFYF